MTSPDDQDLVAVPAAQARRILDLLGTCEQVISALRARGQRRGLAAALDAAQRELAAAVLAGEAR